MRIFGRSFFEKVEKRSVTSSSEQFFKFFGIDNISNSVNVTVDNALGVPAIWAAVQFLSGTMASLPLEVFRSTRTGRVKAAGKINNILHKTPNDEMSSFEWRKYVFEQVFTGGRGLSFIERNAAGQVMNIWPLNPTGVKVKRKGGRKIYEYNDGNRTVTYQANEVLDIPFMLKSDMISSRSPILTNKDVVSKAISSTKYGSKLFSNGGVPPFSLSGPFSNAEAMKRASKDLTDSVKRASENGEIALPIPAGHELKNIGIDPEKMQLVEAQKAEIIQIARIYNLPPVFLQDLTYGTFSNTEQQDLQLVKHTLRRWVKQFEQELDLKLFGRDSSMYVKINLDGLLRGDIKTRYEAYGVGIQNGFKTPNEVRKLENDEQMEGNASKLFIQGATVPLDNQNGDMTNG